MSVDHYAQAVIRDLRKALRDAHAAVPADVQIAATRAIRFLERRLTQAAIHGCHHCGEGDSRAAPCRWCGLRDVAERAPRADEKKPE